METLQAGKKTKIIFLIFIIFFVVLQSYPVFWVLTASLKTPEEIATELNLSIEIVRDMLDLEAVIE